MNRFKELCGDVAATQRMVDDTLNYVSIRLGSLAEEQERHDRRYSALQSQMLTRMGQLGKQIEALAQRLGEWETHLAGMRPVADSLAVPTDPLVNGALSLRQEGLPE